MDIELCDTLKKYAHPTILYMPIFSFQQGLFIVRTDNTH